jgi:hypothetical protein
MWEKPDRRIACSLVTYENHLGPHFTNHKIEAPPFGTAKGTMNSACCNPGHFKAWNPNWIGRKSGLLKAIVALHGLACGLSILYEIVSIIEIPSK